MRTGWIFICALVLAAGCGDAAMSYDDGGYDYEGYGGAAGDGYYTDDGLPPTNEGDEFEAPGTNPFVVTGHDPFSTFGADVDTASYDIFRRDIEYGYLPDPDSVRLEEYVNYFAYDYPQGEHDAAVPFTISLAAAKNFLDGSTTLVRVGIQGKQAPPQEQDQPANLVFLVDVSGSMTSATKLGLVKLVLEHTVEILRPADRIAIVTYASGTGIVLDSTPVSERETILAAIADLEAGGSTAGAAGLTLAYTQAEANFIEGGINHILLCTDGDFNVGPSSNADLLALIEEKRQGGVTLTVLGFGTGNLNDSMMEAITNAGNGIYGVISSEAQAIAYVEERMLSTLVHIAKDVKLQVEFNPDHVYAYRLLGYENRAIADDEFRDDTVDGGEIGSGHRVTALYELVLVGDEIPAGDGAPEKVDGTPIEGEREIAAGDMVLAKVRYKAPGATDLDPAAEVSTTLQPAAINESYASADEDLQWAAAIAAFAEILKDSPYANADNLEIIQAIVAGQATRDDDRAEFATLFAEARALLALP